MATQIQFLTEHSYASYYATHLVQRRTATTVTIGGTTLRVRIENDVEFVEHNGIRVNADGTFGRVIHQWTWCAVAVAQQRDNRAELRTLFCTSRNRTAYADTAIARRVSPTCHWMSVTVEDMLHGDLARHRAELRTLFCTDPNRRARHSDIVETHETELPLYIEHMITIPAGVTLH
ncbi:hypothetical protein HUU62_08645 [Rhodoferax sp. 4810]|uniref:Uncharacterized protein n=1 Tax=Thiospirillum jenense TaxID=1653858 RepID=A0A839H8Y9_9GAMM|nr:hypothetical protein [Thiospirillum jenense]MBB1074477.1 hypothetical protein [Rhodoferax jenense]MBB1125541.1 hypothetical protein [Thiospirillum jenense]